MLWQTGILLRLALLCSIFQVLYITNVFKFKYCTVTICHLPGVVFLPDNDPSSPPCWGSCCWPRHIILKLGEALGVLVVLVQGDQPQLTHQHLQYIWQLLKGVFHILYCQYYWPSYESALPILAQAWGGGSKKNWEHFATIAYFYP